MAHHQTKHHPIRCGIEQSASFGLPTHGRFVPSGYRCNAVQFQRRLFEKYGFMCRAYAGQHKRFASCGTARQIDGAPSDFRKLRPCSLRPSLLDNRRPARQDPFFSDILSAEDYRISTDVMHWSAGPLAAAACLSWGQTTVILYKSIKTHSAAV